MKAIYSILFVLPMLLILVFSSISVQSIFNSNNNDIDPLVDLEVTFKLLKIRSLEKSDDHLNVVEFIDRLTPPDFYVKIWINNDFFQSPVWKNIRYVYSPNWNVTSDVPDDTEWVNITIQVWDWNIGKDQQCDISGFHEAGKKSYEANLYYNLKYGQWLGDDYLEEFYFNADPSGYGRLNGCDDGSIYQHDFDVELWFDITQNDYDKDTIPYWIETELYHTDPTYNDQGMDDDQDGIPIEWEYKWGQSITWDYQVFQYKPHCWYDPFIWGDHNNLDPDNDGLSNAEEYLTAPWGSDPLRKDLFVEMDQMDLGPNGEKTEFPEESKELIRTVYNRRNIIYHLDDGSMGGGEYIPFDECSTDDEIRDIYWNYFLHNDPNNWRCGVFHYGLVIYNAERFHGFGFSGKIKPVIDAFQISAKGMDQFARYPWTDRVTVFASAYLHECGHTLGIFHGNTPGCDDQNSRYPWQRNWWKWRPYKSVMNYGYMYLIVDYSDGSRGKHDFDDWSRIDLTYFQTLLW